MLDGSIEVQSTEFVVKQGYNERKIDLEEFSSGAKRIYEIDIQNDMEGLNLSQRTFCEIAIRAIAYLRQKLKEIDVNEYRELPLKYKVK